MERPTLERRSFIFALAALPVVASSAVGFWPSAVGANPAPSKDLIVYKTPWCGCCGAWVDHMRANGFDVTVMEREDLAPVKAQFHVPPALQSCHTGLIEGYVVEGHVPATDVTRLLAERPSAAGLAVPGMPIGSPGMEQGHMRDPYNVVLFGDSGQSVFATY